MLGVYKFDDSNWVFSTLRGSECNLVQVNKEQRNLRHNSTSSLRIDWTIGDSDNEQVRNMEY